MAQKLHDTREYRKQLTTNNKQLRITASHVSYLRTKDNTSI